MAHAKTGAYGIIFIDGAGETRTARGYSHGDPKIAGEEYERLVKAKNPKNQFNKEVGKGLWPIVTQADEEHWSSIEEANRAKQADEGKLTVQELTKDLPNLVLEPAEIINSVLNNATEQE